MRLRWIARLAVLLAFFLVHAGTALAQDDPCRLPKTLQSVIAMRYPGAKLLTSSDLSEGDRVLFQKDHGNDCPGLVHVNFYGDGKPTVALVLIAKTGTTDTAELVLAHEIGQDWKTVLLDKAGASRPAAWSQGPGDYEDVYGEKKVRATLPVVVFCEYDSWAILYLWTGSKIAKIWLRD